MKPIAAMVAVVALSGLVVAQGQDVQALIKQLKSNDVEERRAAALELGQLGPAAKDAVEDLAAALKKETDPNVRRNVIVALGKIGPDARKAIPELLTALVKTPPNRADAAAALARVGKASVRALANFLVKSETEYKDPDLRNHCLEALKNIGPDAAEAVPVLRKFVGHPDAGFRSNVCIALGRVGPEAKGVILDLLERLDLDTDGNVRLNAMDALGNIGPESAKAVRSIANFLNDGNGDTVRRAAEALAKIGGPGIPPLLKALESTNPNVRVNALRALARVPRVDSELIPPVVPGLKDPNEEVRRLSNDILQKSDPRLSVPAFLVLLGDPNEGLRKTAREVLDKLGKNCIAVFIDLVRNGKEEVVRQRAAEELAALAPDSRDAVPALKEALLKDSSEAVRKAAGEALEKLGTSPVVVLQELLQNPDANLRRFGMASLAEMGDRAAPVQKAIAQALRTDKDAGVRRNAVFALKAIGKKALPDLAPAVKDPDPGVRQAFIKALGEVAGEDPKTVPLLVQALGDPEPAVRFESAEALAAIGPPAAEAVPALALTLRDKDPQVRKSSAAALSKMGSTAVGPLSLALRHKDREVRYLAIQALEDLGVKSAPALPGILNAMLEAEEPYEKVRRMAPVIVRDLRRDRQEMNPPMAKQAVPALVQALKDSDQDVRTNAAWALIEFAKDEAIVEHLPAVGEALKDAGARSSAAVILSRVGPRAVDVLTRALLHKDPETRRTACRVLGEIGPPARSALPALQAATEDKDAEVREEAQRAILNVNR
jgi:HEAT repeat protein